MNFAERKEKIRKWTSLGLVLLAGLIVSPVIFLAIKGIIGLAIAGVVGLSVVTFAPVLGMKFANMRVKAIMAEASENPIETMINLLTAKKQAYVTFRENVETAATAEKEFGMKCARFAQKYPARASEFNTQLSAMRTLVQRKFKALSEAKTSIELAEDKLVEMQAYWEMSQAAQAANKAAGMETGDLYEKLKADTAVDAVFESVNRAFAQLEVAAALDENSGIEYNPSEVIDINVVKQKVSVS